MKFFGKGVSKKDIIAIQTGARPVEGMPQIASEISPLTNDPNPSKEKIMQTLSLALAEIERIKSVLKRNFPGLNI